jgi:hypothetical protein
MSFAFATTASMSAFALFGGPLVVVPGRDEDVGYPAQHELGQLVPLHIPARAQDAVQSGAHTPLVPSSHRRTQRPSLFR